MVAKEFETSHAFIKLKREALDLLCEDLKREYMRLGGSKDLGTKTTQDVFEDLVGFFKDKFKQQKITVTYTKNCRPHTVENPGWKFLRRLFYEDKLKEVMQCHQYNIDLCWIFTYGETYATHLRKKKVKARSGNEEKNGIQQKVVISTLSSYGTESESIKRHIEHHFGLIVEKDFRDMSSLSVGPLVKYYSDPSRKAGTLHLIGKSHFLDETFVTELIQIRKKWKKLFTSTTGIILLPDVCSGEWNISSTTGIHKLNEAWHEQIKYIDEVVIPRSVKDFYDHQDKEIFLGRINQHKNRMLDIISEMDSLASFLLTETQSMPYNYLVNNSRAEEVQLLLKVIDK